MKASRFAVTRRCLKLTLICLLALADAAAVYADQTITVKKVFKGGKESIANPNQVIVAWSITLSGVTSQSTIVFVGRTGDNTIEVEYCETEKAAKSTVTKEILSRKIPLYLECDGETVCKIEEFTFSMRLSGNTLHYVVLTDWDTVYIKEKEQMKQCRYGHKWIEKDFLYCPACGSPLK